MITIVTDSSSYFKKDEAQELGIKIIPLSYTVNGRIFLESFTDQNGDFEHLIKSNNTFSTSQPNWSAFLSCFEEETAMGNEVLCITISSRLSGTYSTAYMAAKQIEGKSIAVLDSRLTAGGLYLLIKKAKSLIENGFSLCETAKILLDIRDRISVFFSVDDMAPLRRSGRIGFVRLSVSTILNKKPILLLQDGVVVSNDVAGGDIEIIKKLIRNVHPSVKELVVSYLGNSRLATNIFNVLKDKYPSIPIGLQKLGPVLGIHLGLNTVAVSLIED